MPIASPAQVLQEYFIAQGFGTKPMFGLAWPIFINFLPANPNNAIAIYDSGGRQDGRLMQGPRVEKPGNQFAVRSANDVDGYAKARAIRDRLDEMLRVAIVFAGYTYTIQSISRTTNIIAMGRDEGAERPLFTVNALITISEVPL